MLRRKRIDSSNADDADLRHLYETAFPVEEQIPYDELIDLLKVLSIDYCAYYDEETLVGLTMVMHLPNYNWGWYFAVQENLRGRGYGQEILSQILNEYREARPFVIDIESPQQPDAPNCEQRTRRHAFYKRNGMKDTPTSRTYNGITYTIMTNSDAPFGQQDYDDIVAALLQVWKIVPDKE